MAGAHRVHPAQDRGRAHAAGDAGEALVDQAHDGAALRRRLRHDARLRAAVHERLHLVPVHLRGRASPGLQRQDGTPGAGSLAMMRLMGLSEDRCHSMRCITGIPGGAQT